MILVVSAAFPASFSLHYKFIMHNYVQFGIISYPCLGEALCLGPTGRIKYWCLEGAILFGQGYVTYRKRRSRSIVQHKESRNKWILEVNCTYHLKLLILRVFTQTENVDHSNPVGTDSLQAITDTEELRFMRYFYSPNTGTQGRMKTQFRS